MNKKEAEKRYKGVIFDGDEFNIHAGAILMPECTIGDNCRICNNAVIEAQAILNGNVLISEGVTVRSFSIIRSGTVLF